MAKSKKASKKSGWKVLVLHGPTLSMLGTRETHLYGTGTLVDLDKELRKLATELSATIDARQTNREGELIDWLLEARKSFHGVLINPAAYSHTSLAIRDAISAISVPCVEVHMTNIHARESFRTISMTAPACVGVVSGFGASSYLLGLRALIDYLSAS